MRTYLILIILCLTGCIMEPGGDFRLTVINQANYQIGVDYNTDTIPKYPSVIDEELYLDHPVMINDTFQVLERSHKPWPFFFEKSKNKKLNLFIYNLDSLKLYNSIDTLIKKKIYQKLEYSEQELEKLKWIVVVKSK